MPRDAPEITQVPPVFIETGAVANKLKFFATATLRQTARKDHGEALPLVFSRHLGACEILE